MKILFRVQFCLGTFWADESVYNEAKDALDHLKILRNANSDYKNYKLRVIEEWTVFKVLKEYNVED